MLLLLLLEMCPCDNGWATWAQCCGSKVKRDRERRLERERKARNAERRKAYATARRKSSKAVRPRGAR